MCTSAVYVCTCVQITMRNFLECCSTDYRQYVLLSGILKNHQNYLYNIEPSVINPSSVVQADTL